MKTIKNIGHAVIIIPGQTPSLLPSNVVPGFGAVNNTNDLFSRLADVTYYIQSPPAIRPQQQSQDFSQGFPKPPQF